MGTTMGEADVIGELEDAWIHEGEQALRMAKMPLYGTTLLPIHLARLSLSISRPDRKSAAVS